MNKKNLYKWALYDFANSIVFINFLLYFSQWLVIDGGLSDLKYNIVFAVSSILLFFSAPTFASFADKYGGRRSLLNISTIGTVLGYGCAAGLAFLGNQYIIIITALFLLGQYCYQLSFVFYNSMIDDVADINHRARASGIGQLSNSLGQVCGLIIAMPLSETRLQPLFPSIIIFVLLALPMMLSFVESRSRVQKLTFPLLADGQRLFMRKMIVFFSVSLAVPMLVSFFFFNDGFVTISNNFPIYIERVFGVSDDIKNYLLLAILLMGGIGGIVSGWIADKMGDIKTLKITLICWVILIPLIASAKGLISLSILSVALGFFIGPIWTVSRSYLSKLLTRDEMSYGFTFYTLSERFATLLGPLVWGGIIAVLGSDAMSYRIALLSMAIFVVIGLIIIWKWKRV
jgi:UMF1 family MFS transporter